MQHPVRISAYREGATIVWIVHPRLECLNPLGYPFHNRFGQLAKGYPIGGQLNGPFNAVK